MRVTARRIVVVAVALGALLALPAPRVSGSRGDRLPYRLVVRVIYGPAEGPESLREELELGLVRSIQDARCFEAVLRHVDEAPPAADLALDVRVDDLVEETTFDLGVSSRQSPDLPVDTRNRGVATLEARFAMWLTTVPDGRELRSRDSVLAGSYRPVLAEDAALGARTRLLQTATRTGTKFACKGSAKALVRAIDRAPR